MSLLQAKIKSRVTGAISSVLPTPIPETIIGKGCIDQLGAHCKKLNLKKILIVTDEILPTLGLLDSTYESLRTAGLEYALFDKVMPDPSCETCVEGCKVYIDNKCDGIIAFGGGSSMDCAKFLAVLTTNPKADPKSFLGTFQLGVFTKLPIIIAVPTTAGTGSETTIAAVISFPKEQKKFAVMDPKLIPPFAYLDPLLIKNLPKPITAATGMDALTHAVESYVAPWRSAFTADYSLRAVKNIFDYLPTCVTTPGNLVAREKMLVASFDAGIAFTRAGVGYVHAIAHQLGALYHVPHGVANAMLLHHVLEFYRSPPTNTFAIDGLATLGMLIDNRGHEKLSKLTSAEKDYYAKFFVDRVRELTALVEIPTFAKNFHSSMVDEIVTRALNECHGNSYDFWESPVKNLMDAGYPVPKYMTFEDCATIVRKVVDPNAPIPSKL